MNTNIWPMIRRVAVTGMLGALVLAACSSSSSSKARSSSTTRGSGTSSDATQVTGAQWSSRGVEAAVKLGVELRSAQSLRIAAIPVGTANGPRDTLNLYLDKDYAIVNANAKGVLGFFQHLQVELGLRGYRGSTSQIDTAALVEALRDTKTASQRIIVIATGVLPVSVVSRSVNLLKPWLEAGGALVWVGPRIGFYEQPAKSPITNVASNLRGAGDQIALGLTVYDKSKEKAPKLVATPAATAFSLEYHDTSQQLSSVQVVVAGGQLIGRAGSTRASIAVVPVRSGRVVIFGGLLYDQQIVAHDLAEIIATGLIDTTGPLATEDIDTAHLASDGSFTWNIPAPAKTAHLVLSIFDPSSPAVITQLHVDR